jgi:hypothetical protein
MIFLMLDVWMMPVGDRRDHAAAHETQTAPTNGMADSGARLADGREGKTHPARHAIATHSRR